MEENEIIVNKCMNKYALQNSSVNQNNLNKIIESSSRNEYVYIEPSFQFKVSPYFFIISLILSIMIIFVYIINKAKQRYRKSMLIITVFSVIIDIILAYFLKADFLGKRVVHYDYCDYYVTSRNITILFIGMIFNLIALIVMCVISHKDKCVIGDALF